ncbi:LPD29 domain-containing protein [Komagataeibacter europaeus]|uniref:LPD29 domain-containing protein n=1 Tax=Komagataeibacter europaeus TaxID=33995 RepID=UPI0002F17A30|nr:LPD29 domain-containing protein [Komagataeibacter europaeus]GBQ47895.1 hypothetical protein AA18890_2843 [Komagataeibacter europaeus LMG 18890]
MQAHYLSVAETARLLRKRLKKAFPATRFSVRSKSYSTGGSISVSWMDGPAVTLVEPLVKSYQAGRFDGSIDLAVYAKHWLLPDGSVQVASDEGTKGCGGVLAAERNWMPSPDCKLVSLGATAIFARRSLSPDYAGRIMAHLTRKGLPDGTLSIQDRGDGSAVLVGRLGGNRHMVQNWQEQATKMHRRFMVA